MAATASDFDPSPKQAHRHDKPETKHDRKS